MSLLQIAKTAEEKLNTTVESLPHSHDDFNLTGILNFAYAVVGILAVVYVVVGGIQYVTSNGDPGKASKALKTIIFSLVGLAIVLTAAALTNFVFTSAGGVKGS